MLVGIVLTVLTVAVLQLGLAVYVRNIVHDAAVEGAYRAALADTTLPDGIARTEEILARSVGEGFAGTVSARETRRFGHPSVEVTVQATLPLLGLLGPAAGLEVTAHAPVESLG
ncbi:TadE/TadG family type IV pilus assembly protein [Microbacterium sp. MC2]